MIYEPKSLILPNNWQDIAEALPEPTPYTPNYYQDWLKLLRFVDDQSYWQEQMKQGFRKYPRVGLNQTVGIFDFSGRLFEEAIMQDFSPKGIRIAGEKPLLRNQKFLLAAPGFRAAGEIKYSSGTIAGAELLGLKLLQSHFLIDTKV